MVMLLVPAKKDPPSPVAVRLGSNLQKLRERVGKTQQQVADALVPPLSNKTVSAYENGHAVLGADDFEAWAIALGVSVAELTSALGLGLPLSATKLREGLSGALGPDKGDLMGEVVQEIRDWPERDQRFIIELFRRQTFNWPDRPKPPD